MGKEVNSFHGMSSFDKISGNDKIVIKHVEDWELVNNAFKDFTDGIITEVYIIGGDVIGEDRSLYFGSGMNVVIIAQFQQKKNPVLQIEFKRVNRIEIDRKLDVWPAVAYIEKEGWVAQFLSCKVLAEEAVAMSLGIDYLGKRTIFSSRVGLTSLSNYSDDASVVLEEFSQEMDRLWEQARQEALELKDSHRALDRLRSLYQSFDEDNRALADDVLCKWALSNQENKRFDAIALISDFQIRSALPALRELVVRLEESEEPSALLERDKAERIIGELSSGSDK